MAAIFILILTGCLIWLQIANRKLTKSNKALKAENELLMVKNKILADTISKLKPQDFEETYAVYYAMLYMRARKMYMDYKNAFQYMVNKYIDMPFSATKLLIFTISDAEKSLVASGVLHPSSLTNDLVYIPFNKILALGQFFKTGKAKLTALLSTI